MSGPSPLPEADPHALDRSGHQQSIHRDAPPGARAMAVVRWLLVAVMALVAGLSVVHSFGHGSNASANDSAVQYFCPMHPRVVQDHPGECPICGMTLVERTSGSGRGRAGPPSAESAEAPAQPGQEQDGSHAGHRHEAADGYFCPMHPEETGVDADARCPICGMKLGPRAAPEPGPVGERSRQPARAVTAPSAGGSPGVAGDTSGLAPIELSLDRIQSIGVRTATATMEELSPELQTVAVVTVDEARLARVHSRFSGWIEELAVGVTGQKVARGQVLARLYNLELLPAQNEFLSARSWIKNGQALAREPDATAGVPTSEAAPRFSPSTLERDARARLELFGISAAEIDQISRTGEPLRTVAVLAPIGGHVITKNAVRGAYVEPGTELFEIADLSRVWALADVYEHDIGRVRVGQRAEVRVDAFPERRFVGSVGFLYPTVDVATRTLRLRIELANEALSLRPGMYARVAIRLDPAWALTVPSEALADTGERQYVFLAREGGRFEPRRVRTGVRVGERVQILEGISAGDVVVSTANFLIDSESRLRAAIQGNSP